MLECYNNINNHNIIFYYPKCLTRNYYQFVDSHMMHVVVFFADVLLRPVLRMDARKRGVAYMPLA